MNYFSIYTIVNYRLIIRGYIYSIKRIRFAKVSIDRLRTVKRKTFLCAPQ